MPERTAPDASATTPEGVDMMGVFQIARMGIPS